MPLSDWIRAVAEKRGMASPGELNRALQSAGVDVTYQAVYGWWNGQIRRLKPKNAAEMVRALALSETEADALRDVQAEWAAVQPGPASDGEAA